MRTSENPDRAKSREHPFHAFGWIRGGAFKDPASLTSEKTPSEQRESGDAHYERQGGRHGNREGADQ